jgi:hypothetical protein
MNIGHERKVSFTEGTVMPPLVEHTSIDQQEIFIIPVAGNAANTNVRKLPILNTVLKTGHIDFQQFIQTMGPGLPDLVLGDGGDGCRRGSAGYNKTKTAAKKGFLRAY